LEVGKGGTKSNGRGGTPLPKKEKKSGKENVNTRTQGPGHLSFRGERGTTVLLLRGEKEERSFSRKKGNGLLEGSISKGGEKIFLGTKENPIAPR